MNDRANAALRTTGSVLLYALALGLLLGGTPQAPGTFHAAGALLAAGLLARVARRSPAVALVVTVLGALVVVYAHNDRHATRLWTFAAPDVALGVLAARTSRGRWFASAALTFTTQAVAIAGQGSSQLAGYIVVALLAIVTASVIGLLGRERREHATALREQEVAEAVTAERLRIARELHDMVAHSIGIIAIQAGVGSRVIDTQPAEARAALRAVEETSRETLAGLRRTLVALREAEPGPAAVPLGPAPGLDDLERLATATADAGVTVDLRWGGRRRPLPPDLELSAYRIVQEAVTNVVRHARTGRCRVRVEYGEEEVSVEVVDDGRGMRDGGAAGGGFGLTGMRERVALLHGRFEAGPRPGGGFRVAAALPVPAEADR
ncbi:histidine kinase [Streptomyces sp. RFCAC02]|uniref:sensor histidine kinase n=1 Tax=Streptomyces sp. RFCAC02 TaxID=2499143 RepID=UPI0010221A68|nr:histidine kinase [Streptomyces sp. RFCAC02]